MKKNSDYFPSLSTRANKSKDVGRLRLKAARKLTCVDDTKRFQLVDRLYLCVVAIALLWSTSLLTSRVLVERWVPRPNATQVSSFVYQAIQVINEESKRYEECIVSEKVVCGRDVGESVEREVGRVAMLNASNSNKVDKMASYSETCESMLDVVTDAIRSYQTKSGLVQDLEDLMRPGMGKDPKCLDLNTLIEAEVAARETIGESKKYITEVDNTVARMSQMVRSRHSYDVGFLQRKKKTLDDMGHEMKEQASGVVRSLKDIQTENAMFYKCLASDSDHSDCPGMMKRVREFHADFLNNYSRSYAKYLDLQDGIYSIKRDLERFQSAYNDFTNKLAVKFVLWVVNPPGLNVGAIFSKALGKLGAPDPVEHIKHLADEKQAAIEDTLQEIANTHEERVGSIAEEQSSKSQQNAGSQSDVLSSAFEDYAPPQGTRVVDADNATNEFRAASRGFLESIKTTVNGLGDLSAKSADKVVFNDTIGESAWETITSGSGSLNDPELIQAINPTSWNFFFYEDFSLQDWLEGWNSFSGLIVLFDLIFRSAQSVQVVVRYMRLSKAITPYVDVRDSVDDNDDDTDPTCSLRKQQHQKKTKKKRGQTARPMTPAQRLAWLFLHPMTNVFFGFTLLWILGSIFMSLYSPLYTRYAEACVSSTASHQLRGTILSENAAALALQYASRNGATIATATTNDMNSRNARYCGKYSTESRDDLVAQASALSYFVEERTPFAERLETLAECLDLGKIMDPRVTSLSNCFTPPPTLAIDSVFNCSVIRSCELRACVPPSEQLIRYWTWVSSCGVEAHIQGYIVSTILSALVFTLLNIARILFIKGLRYVLWRTLAGDMGQYDYIATINLQEEDHNQLASLRKEIHTKIQYQLLRFTRTGSMYIVFSCLITVPALYVVSSVSATLHGN